MPAKDMVMADHKSSLVPLGYRGKNREIKINLAVSYKVERRKLLKENHRAGVIYNLSLTYAGQSIPLLYWMFRMLNTKKNSPWACIGHSNINPSTAYLTDHNQLGELGWFEKQKKQPWPAFIISLIASSMVAYRTLVWSGDMPSLTDEPLGKDKWWINLNSPGTFFGTMPKGDIRNRDSGGDKKGPASWWAANSFPSLASTTSGFSRADNKFVAVCEVRSPSKCTGKPLVKPDNKNSTVEGVYPSRRKTNLLTFIGVGRLGKKGFGSLRLGMVEFGRVTKITLSHHVWPFTPITKILESTTLRAFVAFMKTKTVALWDGIRLCA